MWMEEPSLPGRCSAAGRTGDPTPPEVIRTFQQATEISTGGPTGGAPKSEGEKTSSPVPTAFTGGVAPITADIQADIATIVQVQTGSQTETEAVPVTPPRRDIGYFAAMLTNTASGGSLKDVFIQGEDHRRYEIDTARGKGLDNNDHYIEARAMGSSDPGFTHSPYLTRVYLGSSTDSGDMGNTRPTSETVLGRTNDNYMAWGYWTMTNPVQLGTDFFVVNNKAYYIVGQATEDLDRIKKFGEVTYTGNAWGTFWNAAGGSDLSGGFSTKVNLNSGSLTEFSMDLKDSGAVTRASILNATGTVYGNANANNNCGHFDIDAGSGTWQLDGAAPTSKAARGTLYGPDAEHIGGIWGMYTSGSPVKGAAGIFKGSRPTN